VVEPYGCDVLIEVAVNTMTNTTVERHFKGNEATARRRAKSVRNFRSVLAVVPWDKETWIRAYGEGRM
jgi:hypothetical protein